MKRCRFASVLAWLTIIVFVVAACAAPSAPAPAAPTKAPAAAPTTAPAPAVAPSFKTVKPGVLMVAIDNDVPYCKEENGRITGIDGEIIHGVADKLGLKVEPVVMEWAAEIQAVQSGRVDTNMCGMAFTEERAKVINFTEGAYYQPTDFTQLKTSNFKSVDDLKGGKKVGTIQGYYYIPNLKKIPWVGEENLKLYNTVDAAIQDLLAKRVDALLLGAPVAAWLELQHPEWNIKYETIEPTEYMPDTVKKAYTVYSSNKDNPGLAQAMSQEIARMKKDGTIKKILAKYNMDRPAFIMD